MNIKSNKKSFTLLNNFTKGKIAVKQHLTGFTLVELLVVISIIAILAAISIPQVAGVIDRARDTAIKADMAGVALIAARIDYERGSLSTVHCNSGNDLRIEAICAKVDHNSPRERVSIISRADADRFCIEAPLNEVLGQSWCVDQTGISRLLTGRVCGVVNLATGIITIGCAHP